MDPRRACGRASDRHGISVPEVGPGPGGEPVTDTMVRRAPRLLGLLAAFVFAAPSARAADDPQEYFKASCYGCHTIGGGDLQGPDLKDVETRVQEGGKDRAWLIRWITDPGAVLDSGDPYALKLFEKFKNVRMPNVAGMSEKRAEQMLTLIAEESKLLDAGEKGRFKGLTIPMRPFTPDEVDRGRDIFLGRASLAAGGPACVSCHHVGGLPLLGGGRLGLDLTRVSERMQDRRTLVTWLSAPATVTMLPTFKDHPLDVDTEIMPLAAFLENTAKTQQEDDEGVSVLFLLLGLGGAGASLILFNRLWAFRFRAVRKPLLRRASWRERAEAAPSGSGQREGAAS